MNIKNVYVQMFIPPRVSFFLSLSAPYNIYVGVQLPTMFLNISEFQMSFLQLRLHS